MKKHLFIAALAVSTLFISCKEEEKADNFKFENAIRGMENPLGAISISVNQLIEKSGIKQDEQFGSNVAMVLNVASMAGIDLNSKVYIAANGTNKENVQLYAMINIKSSKEIEKQLSSIATKEGIQDFENGYKMAKVKDASGIIIFNEKRILAVFTPGYTKKSEMEGFAKSLLENGGETAEKNPIFKGFEGLNNDLSFVYNMESVMKLIPESEKAKIIAQSPKVIDLYNDSKIAGSLNFLNGNCNIHADYAFPAMEKYDLIPEQKVSGDFASLLTNNKLFGFAIGRYNLEGMKLYLNDFMPKEDGDVEYKQKEVMERLTTLSSYLTGEIAMSMVEVPESGEDDMEEINIDIEDSFAALEGEETEEVIKDLVIKSNSEFRGYVIALGVSNEAGINSVLDTVSDMTKLGNYYSIDNGKAFAAVKNGKMIFTGKEDIIKDFSVNGTLTLQADAAKYIESGFNGMYDLTQIKNELKDKEGMENLDEVLNLMKNASFHFDMKSMDVDLNFTDSSNNSLKQIVNLVIKYLISGKELSSLAGM